MKYKKLTFIIVSVAIIAMIVLIYCPQNNAIIQEESCNKPKYTTHNSIDDNCKSYNTVAFKGKLYGFWHEKEVTIILGEEYIIKNVRGMNNNNFNYLTHLLEKDIEIILCDGGDCYYYIGAFLLSANNENRTI